MLLIVGVTLLRIKKHKYMIYAFRVTAKQNIGGSKGMGVQIKKDVESSGKCKISDLPEGNILWAVEIRFFTRSSIDFILNFAD